MHTFTKKMPIVSLFSFLFFALKFGYKFFVSLLVPEMCAFSARFFFLLSFVTLYGSLSLACVIPSIPRYREGLRNGQPLRPRPFKSKMLS